MVVPGGGSEGSGGAAGAAAGAGGAAPAAGCAYTLNAGGGWLCAGAVGVSRDTRLGSKTGAVFTWTASGSMLHAVAVCIC